MPRFRINSTMLTSHTSSSFDKSHLGFTSLTLIVDVTIVLTAFLLGTFFNAAFVASVRRNRRLWTLTNGLLSCEAIVNILVIFIGVSIHTTAILRHPMHLPDSICMLHDVFHFGGHVLSSGIFSVVAYLKYLTVCCKTNCLLRRRRLFAWMAFPCTCTLISTFIIFSIQPQKIACLHHTSSNSTQTSQLISGIPFFLHSLVLIYSYTRISFSVFDARSTRPLNPLPPLPPLPANQVRRRKIPRRRLRVDIVTTLSCLLHSLFAIFIYVLTKLLTFWATQRIVDENKWAAAISLILSFDHAIFALIDPMLYLIVSDEIREEIKAILLCSWNDGKKLGETSDVISRVRFNIRTMQTGNKMLGETVL